MLEKKEICNMKMMYCRYCRKDVPMLDEEEYTIILEVHQGCVKTIKQYRQDNDAALSETPLEELYQPVLKKYEEITGATGFEVDEIIRRHRIARWQKE